MIPDEKQGQGAGVTALSLPFALTVGVTGHRLAAIPEGRRVPIETAIVDALAAVEQAARAVRERLAPTRLFDEAAPTFAMVSPLADGADQFAARAALDRGWRLQAVLPFERAVYQQDFVGEDPSETFEDLLNKASGVLELPGNRVREAESYLLAGRATVAHSDVIIAVWDGAPPRGRGGTAEVVQLAVASGVPVIHVKPAEDQVALLWSGFDPHIVTRNGHDGQIRRPFTADHLEAALEAILSPPADLVELKHLDDFRSERDHRYRLRIEFPLLLTAAGVKRIRASNWRESACVAAIEQEWATFRARCLSGDCGVDAPLGLLEQVYGRSDRLAGHYAQTFRSGHVFNFALMATAALIGVSGFLWPGHQLALAAAEFVVAMLVIANTLVGSRRQWQRRWLDYRQLAERLRPMRSLKLLGIASPDPPGSATDPIARRWVDWYAAAIWRAMGCPSGKITTDRVPQLVTAIRCHEIDEQVRYNRRAAEQAETLDRRLGKVFSFLFGATVFVSGAVVVGRWLAADWVEAHQDWLSLVAAGMPAIATAIFGIRSQGDFAGSAQRSQATAQTLTAIAANLDQQQGDLARSADLVEQAARAMLADLDEWRTVLIRSELEMA